MLHPRERSESELSLSRPIHHVTGTQHWTHAELVKLLDPHVRLASPEEWFAAMRVDGNAEMHLHADVLEKWCWAGWRPFAH